MLLHARVSLPDRPGALAALTANLAGNGADIVNISVLDSDAGRVVDDVYLTCAAGHSSALYLAVACVAGVDILGLRVAERPPGPLADLFLLEQLLGDRREVEDHAGSAVGGLGAVIDALPHVLGADWATATRGGECLAGSLGAPSEAAVPFGPSRTPANGRGQRVTRVSAPLGDTEVMVTAGRDEDFAFHRTEIAHLHRLLAVVASMLGPALMSPSRPAA